MNVPTWPNLPKNGGGTVPHVETRELVRALRVRFGKTQEGVANASGGRLKRIDVVKFEAGDNQVTTWVARAGLAAAFGASVVDVAAYLDGEIDLDELADRISRPQGQTNVAPEPPTALVGALAAERDLSPEIVTWLRSGRGWPPGWESYSVDAWSSYAQAADRRFREAAAGPPLPTRKAMLPPQPTGPVLAPEGAGERPRRRGPKGEPP